MSKYLITTTEIYRVDDEIEVQNLIEEAKHDPMYTLIKYNREYKEKKSKENGKRYERAGIVSG